MSCSKRELKRVRPLLGTYVEITLSGRASPKQLNACADAGFAAIEEIDRLMSFHREDSDLGRLNRARRGRTVAVAHATARVLATCNALWRASRGAFDPRVRSAQAVEPFRIAGLRAGRNGPGADLGGIAKGFAVDQAVDRMRRFRGVSGLVNAGGDLRAWGRRSFSVAVRSGEGLRPLRLRNAAVATSAVGLRPEVRHRRMPSGVAMRKRRTAAVVADRCLWADALTKVALAADPPVAARCLRKFSARAFLFA